MSYDLLVQMAYSGRTSKMRPSCKWPIGNNSYINFGGKQDALRHAQWGDTLSASPTLSRNDFLGEKLNLYGSLQIFNVVKRYCISLGKQYFIFWIPSRLHNSW